MSRLTFYRKYRSNNFDELVGQTHIVETLKNAISNERMAHAYVFSGPRGTGKTSTARILARALNCESGPTASPCGSCGICRKITAGNSVDVIEIDAASNTGVDNIRDLNEQVNFVPVECRTKVYIIDEVHMLSMGAFNALLKTLEEPPPQITFILATTEPQKIPVTIHSRCQRLNFRRLKHEEIRSHLAHVASEEKLEVSDAALMLITRNSDGCMRDALSLLDQIYSFKGASIALEDVRTILGATDRSVLFQLFGYGLAGDKNQILSQTKALIDEGMSPAQVAKDLTEIVTNLLYVKLGVLGELDVDENELTQLNELAGKAAQSQLMIWMEKLAKLGNELRWFPMPEVLLQVSLLGLVVEDEPAAPVQAPVRQAPQATAPVQQQAPAPQANRLPPRPTASAPQSAAPPAAKTPPPAPAPSAPPPAPNAQGSGSWDTVLKKVKSERPGLYSILVDSSVSQGPSGITISLSGGFQFFVEKLKEEKHSTYMKNVVASEFGKEMGIEIVSSENAPPPGAGSQNVSTASASPEPTNSASPADAANPSQTISASNKQATLNQIVDLFEGNLVS